MRRSPPRCKAVQRRKAQSDSYSGYYDDIATLATEVQFARLRRHRTPDPTLSTVLVVAQLDRLEHQIAAAFDDGRFIAVGTTTVRSLESASQKGVLEAYTGETDIFIYPGYQFKSVDALITNFHLPESTLLMLISAFAGKDEMMRCYKEAVAEEYRFFSYGDAMFIS